MNQRAHVIRAMWTIFEPIHAVSYFAPHFARSSPMRNSSREPPRSSPRSPGASTSLAARWLRRTRLCQTKSTRTASCGARRPSCASIAVMVTLRPC